MAVVSWWLSNLRVLIDRLNTASHNDLETKAGSMCPSAPAHAGAKLLGRFTEEGSLAFAATPLRVTNTFLAAANETGDIEKRFRFASQCMQSACSRWQNGRCMVAVAAAGAAGEQKPATDQLLPACAIRTQCRWFAQEGAAACRICPQVVYDMNDVVP
jgi:hypothetical protein